MVIALVALSLSRSATLIGVGDVMLGRWVGKRIEREGVDSPFENVAPLLKKSDLTVGNLECAITDLPFAFHKRYLLKADPKVVTGLKNASFSFLSLANNHAEDCGPAGVTDTKKRLKRAGIESVLPTGSPVFLTKHGMRFAFVGLYDLPGYPLAQNWLYQMQKARAKSDDVIVLVHWGFEGAPTPNERQRKLAHELADAGADLILGSHPHVLQPVETIAGSNHRKCVVAYSLGNFVFDAPKGLQRKTGALKVTFSIHGVTSYHLLHGLIKNGYPESLK